jgi:hypothetical protein
MHLSGGVLHQASLVQFLRRIGHKIKHIRQQVLSIEALSTLKYLIVAYTLTVNNL